MIPRAHLSSCVCEDCVPYRKDEPDKVADWRLHTLIEAGYPVKVAERLAPRTPTSSDPGVDLHQAVELVQDGCPPALAGLILL